ncbi:hypothetical protein ABPG74_005300 [Tetrahymena malaccensis]
MNTQRNQEIGLVIHRIKCTEKIETKYSSNHEINQIQKQIQFGQLLSSFMMIIQIEENQVQGLNQNACEEAFFVQELRLIHTDNYKKENKNFILDEINKENSLLVSQVSFESPWDESFNDYQDIFTEKLEMCKNLSRLYYSQQSKEIQKEELDKLVQLLEKCENLIDLGLFLEINDDFDNQLKNLQNLMNLTSLVLKIYTNQDRQINLSFIRLFQNLNKLQILGHYSKIQNKLDLQNLAQAISQLQNLSYLNIQLQPINDDQQLNQFFQGFPKRSNIIHLNIELILDFQSQDWVNELSRMLVNQVYLKQLNISIQQNEMKQKSFQYFISQLHFLKYLSDLSITIKFSSINFQGIGEELSKCKNLSIFTFHLIRSYKIQAQSQELFKCLVGLPKLKVLFLNFQSSLEDNNILVDSCNLLSKNTNIQKFKLKTEGYQLIEDQIVIQEEIANLKSLNFYLRYQDQKINQFILFLQKCTQLNKLKLSLSNADLKYHDLIELGKCVKQLSNLSFFSTDLSFSELENQAFIDFFELLKQSQNLKKLRIRLMRVDISNDACIQIAQKLTQFPKLTQLHLVISSLSQQTADSMVKILITNKLINVLSIGLNQMYGKSVKNLTKKSILKMRRLVHIQFKNF